MASTAGIGVELVLADVDDGEHRSRRQQEVGSEELLLLAAEPGAVERAAVRERVVGPPQRGELVAERAVELGLPLGLGETLLDGLEVGERQLELDDAQVLQRIGRAGHVVVDERPQHEHDGVDLTDVGEEAVAEPLALARTLDEPADVDDLDGGVHDVAAPRHLGEPVEALVGHLGDADVGVLGGERVRAQRGPRRR